MNLKEAETKYSDAQLAFAVAGRAWVNAPEQATDERERMFVALSNLNRAALDWAEAAAIEAQR